MLARHGEIDLPLPGGDFIGRRRLDTHLLALEGLGATVRLEDSTFHMQADGLHGRPVLLDECSVTATENAVMAATLAEGTTEIHNAASEPHVQELCRFLNSLGARIENIGSNSLVVHGVRRWAGASLPSGPTTWRWSA